MTIMGAQQHKEGNGVEVGDNLLKQSVEENELAGLLLLSNVIHAQVAKTAPFNLAAVYQLCLSLNAKPNGSGRVQVNKGVLLILANNIIDRENEKALDLNDDELEKATNLADGMLCDLREDSTLNQESIEDWKKQEARLKYELEDAYERIEELENALEDAHDEIKALEEELRNAPPSRRSRQRLQHLEQSLDRASVRSDITCEPILPSLDAHISSIAKRNRKFLQLLSDNSDDTYVFGNCSACTVMLQAIASAYDLTQLEKLMQQYAIIWDTNMTVTHQAKKSIACIDMKSPLSLALKALHKTAAQNTNEECLQQLDAAIAAYNKYNGTDKTLLPTIAYKSTGKMNNNITMTILILIGIRVSKKISLERIRQGKLSDKRKEGIASMIKLCVEITGVRPEDETTIAWMYENVLLPACENPSHEIRLRLISCINFLIEEMQHCRFIEDYCNAEVIAMTRLADNVDEYETIQLRETYKASLYVCERKNGGKGDFVAYWRRLVVAKVFFSGICSRLFAERAVKAGLLQGMDVKMFIFGVLNISSSNFYMSDSLNFLYNEENYKHGSTISFSQGEDVKKILTAATTAKEQFEKETHFAEPKFRKYYKDFFASMSTNTKGEDNRYDSNDK